MWDKVVTLVYLEVGSHTPREALKFKVERVGGVRRGLRFTSLCSRGFRRGRCSRAGLSHMLVVLIIRHEDGLFSKINYVGITDRTRSGKKEIETCDSRNTQRPVLCCS